MKRSVKELIARLFQLGHILNPILGGSQFAIGNHEHSSDLFTGLTGSKSIRQPTAPITSSRLTYCFSALLQASFAAWLARSISAGCRLVSTRRLCVIALACSNQSYPISPNLCLTLWSGPTRSCSCLSLTTFPAWTVTASIPASLFFHHSTLLVACDRSCAKKVVAS